MTFHLNWNFYANKVSKLLTRFLIFTFLLLISLSTTSANFVSLDQSKVQNTEPSSQIAFITREQQGDSLVIVDPVTQSQKVIAKYSNSRIVGLPLWSLDCTYLLVDQIGDNKKYITRADLENAPKSENIPPSQINLAAWYPRWSPDRHKLVFEAVDFSEGPRNPDIYTLDVSNNDLVNITNSNQPEADPSWSPDGKIIFSSIHDGHSNIYQMDADGSNIQVIYADPNFENYGPLFSPDGKSIIFASSNKEMGFLKLLTEDKSITDLLSEPKGRAASLAWSPDGQYIAVSTTRPNENAQLNLIDMKTREFHKIAEGGMDAILLFSWSPDSTQIVFQSNQTGNYEIYTLTINSEILTQLSKNDQADLFPSWSPPSCIQQ